MSNVIVSTLLFLLLLACSGWAISFREYPSSIIEPEIKKYTYISLQINVVSIDIINRALSKGDNLCETKPICSFHP